MHQMRRTDSFHLRLRGFLDGNLRFQLNSLLYLLDRRLQRLTLELIHCQRTQGFLKIMMTQSFVLLARHLHGRDTVSKMRRLAQTFPVC